MSPGYPGYYPPANMYMPYGPGMAYMGPPPHGMMMPPPPPGYEHLGQYQQQQQQPSLQHGGEDGQEAPVAQGEGNGTIPPAEVSKSIPCKCVAGRCRRRMFLPRHLTFFCRRLSFC